MCSNVQAAIEEEKGKVSLHSLYPVHLSLFFERFLLISVEKERRKVITDDATKKTSDQIGEYIIDTWSNMLDGEMWYGYLLNLLGSRASR